jgi:hypothetical protein
VVVAVVVAVVAAVVQAAEAVLSSCTLETCHSTPPKMPCTTPSANLGTLSTLS